MCSKRTWIYIPLFTHHILAQCLYFISMIYFRSNRMSHVCESLIATQLDISIAIASCTPYFEFNNGRRQHFDAIISQWISFPSNVGTFPSCISYTLVSICVINCMSLIIFMKWSCLFSWSNQGSAWCILSISAFYAAETGSFVSICAYSHVRHPTCGYCLYMHNFYNVCPRAIFWYFRASIVILHSSSKDGVCTINSSINFFDT